MVIRLLLPFTVSMLFLPVRSLLWPFGRTGRKYTLQVERKRLLPKNYIYVA